MAKKRSKIWSDREAGRVLDRADRSGLSDAEFCRRNRIATKRLSYWRKRLGRKKRPGRKLGFVELRAVASERIEIELRNRRVVRVPASIDVRTVAEFADALEGEDGC
jgi:transposase-like protein